MFWRKNGSLLLSALIALANFICNNHADETVLGKPYITVWNAPLGSCEKSHVHIPLEKFNIQTNPNGAFYGEVMTIFYGIGFWPSITSDGTTHNGGIPQLANTTKHFYKVIADITRMIPDEMFSGLAVIDFESWRPIFAEDFDSLLRYKVMSERLVRKKHPSWSSSKVTQQAQVEFESAARSMFEGTLNLAMMLRPHGHWGFYGIPDCFNHGPGQRHCSTGINKETDRIQWLFQSSSALYPSIYMHEYNNTDEAADYIFGRMEQGLRASFLRWDDGVPVLPYSSYYYDMRTTTFLKPSDIINTVGLGADMGMSGIVLWGSTRSVNTQEKCRNVAAYVEGTFGPYVKAVTEFSIACSENVCGGQGRCVASALFPNFTSPNYEPRKQHAIYMKQRAQILKLIEEKENFFNSIFADLLEEDIRIREEMLHENLFMCKCYGAYKGQHCSSTDDLTY